MAKSRARGRLQGNLDGTTLAEERFGTGIDWQAVNRPRLNTLRVPKTKPQRPDAFTDAERALHAARQGMVAAWREGGGCATCRGFGGACCKPAARTESGLSPTVTLEEVARWASLFGRAREWPLATEPLEGKAGQQRNVSVMPVADWRTQRVIATNTAEPQGSGSVIKQVFFGSTAAFPLNSGGVATNNGIFHPNSLGSGVLYPTTPAAQNITFVVRFLVDCTFRATVFGMMKGPRQLPSFLGESYTVPSSAAPWRLVLRDAWVDAGGCEACRGVGLVQRTLRKAGPRNIRPCRRCNQTDRAQRGLDPTLTLAAIVEVLR